MQTTQKAREFVEQLEKKHQLASDQVKKNYLIDFIDELLKDSVQGQDIESYIEAGFEDPVLIAKIVQDVKNFKTEIFNERAALAAKNAAKIIEKSSDKTVEKVIQKPVEAEMIPEPIPAKRVLPVQDEKKERIFDRMQQGVPRKKNRPEYRNKGQQAAMAGKGEEDAEVQHEKKGLKHQLQQKGKQKCRFFPFCKNQETCEFYHPTEKCTYFPNCRYGESCLYEHEACKFKEKCNKFNCTYAHPFKKNSNPLEELMRGFMQSNNPLARHKKKPNMKPKAEQSHSEQPHQTQN